MIIKEIDWVNGVTYGDGVVLENIPPQLQLPLVSVLSRDCRNRSTDREKFRFIGRGDVFG